MKIELKMPRLRPEMKKGMLCAWLKEEGDTVEKGEAIYEIETDKVVDQVAAEHSGRITRLLAEEGDEVEPGTVIAEIEE